MDLGLANLPIGARVAAGERAPLVVPAEYDNYLPLSTPTRASALRQRRTNSLGLTLAHPLGAPVCDGPMERQVAVWRQVGSDRVVDLASDVAFQAADGFPFDWLPACRR